MKKQSVSSNSSVLIIRAPELIAAEINSIKDQTRTMVLYNSVEIGRRLVELKEQIEHGEWGQWLEKNVDYSNSTANNLMRIYKEYGDKQGTLLENLSYTQAVALLGIPAEEREAFVEDNDVENMSTRELQQAIKDREQAEKDKQEAVTQLNDLKLEKYNSDTALLKVEDERNRIKKELEGIAEKNKAELAKKVAEVEKAKKQAEDLSKKIKELETKSLEVNKGATPEDVEKIKSEATKKYEKELADLKIEKDHAEKRAKDLESKITMQNNEAILKYSIYFEELVKGFKNLLTELYNIKESDLDAYERYKAAVVGLINKMTERL